MPGVVSGNLLPDPPGFAVSGEITTANEAALVAAVEVLDTSPPPGNTGAQTPEGEQCIDWSGFTLPDGTPVEKFVLPWLGEGFEKMESGGHYGYTECWRRGNVTVSAGGRPGMGVHVDCSGQGCRELEQLGVVKDWPTFTAEVLASGGKFSRLDLAVDDRAGKLELEIIRAAAEQGNIVSRYRSIRNDWRHDASTGELTGTTIYLGSRKSESFVRMYDKALELKAKGQKVVGPWVRVELEMHDKRAQVLAQQLSKSSSPGALLAGLLRGLIDIKDRGQQLQRYKWATASYWGEFLNWSSKLHLVIKPAVRTVERTFNWVSNQVAPSLALLRLAIAGDGWLQNLLKEGERRLTPLHYAAINRFYRDEGVDGQSVSHWVELQEV
jgi:phage replication initiation protein